MNKNSSFGDKQLTCEAHSQDDISRKAMSDSFASGKLKATIEDVSRLAGVSVTTVSRVVNGTYPHIAEKTRHRVNEAIKHFHYTPNRLIRSLQEGRTNVIAYTSLFPGLLNKDEVQMWTLMEIYQAARQSGYSVLLPSVLLQEDGVPRVSDLLDGRCDGVILESPRGAPVLDVLADRRFPTVVIGNRYVPQGIGTVHGDIRGGTRQAMDHLLALGHKRIAHLAGPILHWDEAQCRMETYMEALNEAGLSSDRELILPNWGTKSWAVDNNEVRESLEFWLALPDAPTAVFCSSDRLAVALIECAGELGVRVPDDLSVIGFDNMPTVGRCVLPLTTVAVAMDQLASTALEMLCGLIEKNRRNLQDQEPDTTTLSRAVPAELIVRNTTAPPSALTH